MPFGCEKISSSGPEMRKKGVGAVAIRHHGYNPEPLRISLNDIPHLFGDRGALYFDLIFCSGVLGQVQFFRKRCNPPNWPWLGERRALTEAMGHTSSIIQKAVALLSDNPKSAMFIQNFNSFILARRTALEFMGIKVFYWNNEEMHKRQETSLEQMSNLYGSMKQFRQYYEEDRYHLEREEARWQGLWDEGANVAVVAKG
jgi:hypothetical protein